MTIERLKALYDNLALCWVERNYTHQMRAGLTYDGTPKHLMLSEMLYIQTDEKLGKECCEVVYE